MILTPGVACLMTQGSTVSSGVPFRANTGLTSLLTGSLMSEQPPVTCDVLQLWFTGDDPVCTEGQAKTSGQFVNSPGTFR